MVNLFSKYRVHILVILLMGVLVFISGKILGAARQKKSDLAAFGQIHSIREKGSYQFVNPLLATDFTISLNENKTLESKLNGIIKQAQQNGSITSASIYFRDFSASQWVGINEDQKYDPASMLKVVVMIAYLKQADDNRAVLSQAYVYKGEGSGVPYETPSDLKINQTYTVQQLLESMIQESDNGAMTVLLNHVDQSVLSQIYSDLGIESPDSTPGDYLISAKSYSLFFRVLYNATYLSRDSSELALSILSKATFTDGLVAGLPTGTTVAHKFGEHVTGNGDDITSIELHDCGIVYGSDRRYFICVMTKGGKLEDLSVFIKNVSGIVYNAAYKN